MNKEGALEAILFAAGTSVKLNTLSKMMNLDENEILEIANNLKTKYKENQRGFDIIQINESLEMCTNEDYGELVRNALGIEIKQGLSQAALEVLAIIAYNQPSTRAEIEKIRGVKSDKSINTLLDYGLIKEDGRAQTPGRPILYSITQDFFKYFNIKSLKDLPPIEVSP